MNEITEEKREQMNRLYFAAIEFRKAQLKYCENVCATRTREMLESGERLHRILCDINGGKDPVCFMSQTQAICETAAMLARV